MSAAPETFDMLAAMRRLRKALNARIRADEKAERRAARPRLPRGELADYDIAALGRLLRPKLERDGRGWRMLAAEIGVTSPDLSRVMAGQQIAAGKIFAICDWLRIDARRFYRPPVGVARGKCFTGKALKQRPAKTGRAAP